jgi:hypothetical protein
MSAAVWMLIAVRLMIAGKSLNVPRKPSAPKRAGESRRLGEPRKNAETRKSAGLPTRNELTKSENRTNEAHARGAGGAAAALADAKHSEWAAVS